MRRGRGVLWGKLFEKSFPHTPFKNFHQRGFIFPNRGCTTSCALFCLCVVKVSFVQYRFYCMGKFIAQTERTLPQAFGNPHPKRSKKLVWRQKESNFASHFGRMVSYVASDKRRRRRRGDHWSPVFMLCAVVNGGRSMIAPTVTFYILPLSFVTQTAGARRCPTARK